MVKRGFKMVRTTKIRDTIRLNIGNNLWLVYYWLGQCLLTTLQIVLRLFLITSTVLRLYTPENIGFASERQFPKKFFEQEGCTYFIESNSIQSFSQYFTDTGQICNWLFAHRLRNEITMFLTCVRHFLEIYAYEKRIRIIS